MYEVFEKLMEENGVNATAVSKATGIARSTLTDWKKGRLQLKYEKLKMIAEYFGVNVSVFYGEDVQTSGQQDGYYMDEETIRIAQMIHDNKELQLLFDEAKDADPSDLQAAHGILLALKRKERGNID